MLSTGYTKNSFLLGAVFRYIYYYVYKVYNRIFGCLFYNALQSKFWRDLALGKRVITDNSLPLISHKS